MGYWWRRVLIGIGLFLGTCVLLFILGWTAVAFSSGSTRSYFLRAGMALAAVPVVGLVVLAGWLSGKLVHPDPPLLEEESESQRKVS